MLVLLANGLVIAGAGILAASLLLVRRLVLQIPAGRTRRSWCFLGTLIVAFIAGYLSYLGVFWGGQKTGLDLIVPAIFFLGACFVWLTSNLSLQTTNDARRIALLERENIIDGLTGIYNRRYLDRRLSEDLARARRDALPLSVLLIDIDHFKHINDRHGHQAGDLVLVHLSRLIAGTIRHSDIAGRYGGEEFMIVAPNTPELAAGELAERLRHQVETRPCKFTTADLASAHQEIGITVSIGVATSRQKGNGDAQQQLIYQSDMALYRAKQGGRNRIVIHHPDAPLFRESDPARHTDE